MKDQFFFLFCFKDDEKLSLDVSQTGTPMRFNQCTLTVLALLMTSDSGLEKIDFR